MLTRDDLRTALLSPNVRAFLAAIRLGEGTSGALGYRTIVGGSLMETMDKHPGKRVFVERYGVFSTAAGAYQFLGTTWSELVQQYGFEDFRPETQDEGAVALIARRGALDDVLAGRIPEAIRKCAKEWASLPGAGYGQREESLARVVAEYKRSGGLMEDEMQALAAGPAAPAHAAAAQEPAGALASAADTPTPTASRRPASGPPRKPEESAMPVPAIVAAVLPTLVSAVPELVKIFGDRSADSRQTYGKAADKVIEIAQAATGAVNAQAAAERVQSDPAAAAAFKAAVQEQWFQLTESGGGGIEGARKANLEAAGIPLWRQPALAISVLLLPLVYYVAHLVLTGATDGGFSGELKAAVATAIITGVLGGITGFWLGSSFTTSRSRGLGSQPADGVR
jgi:muramidase (phage lysozyme)